MTRFMMSLPDSVNLVLFAFEKANPGDIFVQKSPAATVLTLAKTLLEIFNAKNEINIIGTRHGEKMHETLCSKEEMAKAEDLGNYYRIPADFRDLNYTKYIQTEAAEFVNDEYNSFNTRQLDTEELKKILLELDYVQKELGG